MQKDFSFIIDVIDCLKRVVTHSTSRTNLVCVSKDSQSWLYDRFLSLLELRYL